MLQDDRYTYAIQGILNPVRKERDAALARAEKAEAQFRSVWNALENVTKRGKAARNILREQGGNWGMLDFSSAEVILTATTPEPTEEV